MSPIGARVVTSIRRHPWIGGLSACYVVGWTLYGLITGSRLAIPYLVWILGAGCLIAYVDGRVRFSTEVLVLLSMAGFGHMAGGNLVIEGTLLYEHAWGFVGYDHVLHTVGMGAGGLAVWESTVWMFRATGGKEAAIVTFLGANAVGAIIEIGEYLSTLVIDNVRVGAYANNMQDLIANLLGALLAAWWASRGPIGIPRSR